MITADDRAQGLMEESARRGCDAPTESMIADAIREAESDMVTHCQMILIRYGQAKAADTLGRWQSRRHLDSAESHET